jgi:hypothetical protein
VAEERATVGGGEVERATVGCVAGFCATEAGKGTGLELGSISASEAGTSAGFEPRAGPSLASARLAFTCRGPIEQRHFKPFDLLQQPASDTLQVAMEASHHLHHAVNLLLRWSVASVSFTELPGLSLKERFEIFCNGMVSTCLGYPFLVFVQKSRQSLGCSASP